MTTIRDVALAQPPSAHAPDGSGRQNPNEREQPVTPLQPLHILDGHTARVYRLASIPNNNLFVSGSWDGNCRVWSAKDGEVVGKKMVHGKSVYAIVVSRDGKTMASGGSDGRIVVWDLESREKIIEWKTPSNIMALSLAMSQDSRTLASGHNNGTVMLWSASTGDHIAGPYKLHDDISLVWLPNSGQLISASRDKTIKYWDTSNDSLLIATSHGHSVYALAISSDGNLLASASWDGTTRLWNTSTHKQIDDPPLHILQGHTGQIWRLASIPDSNLFVTGSGDGSCRVWNAKDGGEVGKEMIHGEWVNGIVVSQDGKTMASGGNDGRIVVWSLESREKVVEWKTPSNVCYWSSHFRMTCGRSGVAIIPPFKAHDDGIWSLVWLPNGQLISASRDNTIKYWDTSNGSPLIATSHGHTDAVFALAISSNGKLLASTSRDRTARLWNTSTHEQIGAALQHPTFLLSVALSSDGRYLAAAGQDHEVYIWNLEDIEEVAKIIAEKVCPGYYKNKIRC
ncbi:hypothetical protein PAXINDRAFT_78116 [Paxillus involutus ATCC 200175]|uniref:Unplaced genomic scaffold PAXINscaffold_17, whole genome shotgun sequence n=1 Tax=Paxillus involutus ATCC 200175 TaxID=664439 RepID=A0A0C9SYD2_PAXIN|nr:hypothetical protein PAXINDRAFT_78116 [Paxillus involutus ATCC 200175]